MFSVENSLCDQSSKYLTSGGNRREREREREEEEEEEEESREKSGGGIFEDRWRDRKKN